MNKILKFSILLVGLFLLKTIIAHFYFKDPYPTFEKDSLNIEFNGIVNELLYNAKGYPSIRVDQTFFYVPSASNKSIEIGDSIYKLLGKNIVYQYRSGKLMEVFHGPVSL
ncbi:MAG: hypothetical protein COA33_002685 [Fluviicola sp.]|nr:hypothetical protein [Fluviicola sp.]